MLPKQIKTINAGQISVSGKFASLTDCLPNRMTYG